MVAAVGSQLVAAAAEVALGFPVEMVRTNYEVRRIREWLGLPAESLD